MNVVLRDASPKIFQKSRNSLKILGVITVRSSMTCTKNTQILGANVQNVVPANWRPEFVHSYLKR